MTRSSSHLSVIQVLGAALVAIVLSAAFAFAPAQALADDPDETAIETQSVSWNRLGGADRYATSVAIAKEAFPAGSEWAIVATGNNFPDALSASAMAGVLQCPIILTTTDTLQADAKSALASLKVKKVAIVGGEAAVSAAVADEIKAMGIETVRTAGADRIETSVKVLESVADTKTIDSVAIATGTNYPDALSVGPWSFRHGTPILLVGDDGQLTADEIALIGKHPIKSAMIMGGTAVVSDKVETQLIAAGIADTEIQRFGGTDRYATSEIFAEWALTYGLMPGNMTVATGETFPDALSGAAMCGSFKAPILLVKDASSPTLKIVSDFKTVIDNPFILGGESAVSAFLEQHLNDLLK